MKETPKSANKVINILIKKLSAEEFKVVFAFLYELMYMSDFDDKERMYQRFVNKWTDKKNVVRKKSSILKLKVVNNKRR